MYTYSTINFYELKPAELCDVVIHRFHIPMEMAAEQIMHYFELERQEDFTVPPAADLQQLLFHKMQSELFQVVRKETTILFPMIRNTQPHTASGGYIQQSAFESVQQSFQKITLLQQKLRQVTNNFLLKGEWSNLYKICVNDMCMMEQQIQQYMYVAQNILYPSVLKSGHTCVLQANQEKNIDHTASID
jgi:iron-sulfur cluster repair protein YtfE (RIC family)